MGHTWPTIRPLERRDLALFPSTKIAAYLEIIASSTDLTSRISRISSEGIFRVWEAAAAYVPIGERYRGTRCTGEILGRERRRGRRRGSHGWGGCTRKTGVKSPQKFSTKPLIVLASGKRGGKPRIYNVPMANSVPSLLLRRAYASVAYTCRKNSIAGKNHSRRGGEISSHFAFFQFLAAFSVVPVCQSHDSTSIGPGIYVCMKRKRVVEYVGLALSLAIALTNLTRVAIFPDFGCISLDVNRLPE